jgi:hypothetical protein
LKLLLAPSPQLFALIEDARLRLALLSTGSAHEHDAVTVPGGHCHCARGCNRFVIGMSVKENGRSHGQMIGG